MIKKLKSNSGAAFVLAMIFFMLMWFLTQNSIELLETNGESIVAFQKNEYNYFIAKSALNHYSDLLSGLQYTETTEGATFTLPSTSETYTQGFFQVVDTETDGSYTVNDDKTDAFKLLIKSDDFNDAFAYFQRLRSEVLNGAIVLSTTDDLYKPAYQAFSVNFVIEGLENLYDPTNDFVLTTTVTFFGELVSYDGFNSFNENTARIRTVLSCDGAEVYSKYITCIPTLDDSSGLNVWTWESFS